MRLLHSSIARMLLSLTLCALLASAPLVRGQQPAGNQPARAQDDEVVRINTELVQTDVMVFDKQGRFVEGLRPEQFELSLDGKAQPVSFFERVATGSAGEAAQVRAAQKGAASSGVQKEAAIATPSSVGRVIFFFVDDLHLGESSLVRARKGLADFVLNQMGQNDRVAIVSASGQIGFLQQLTDYKPMLGEAIERLNNKRVSEASTARTRISEYQANQVVNHGDTDLMNYLISSTMNEYQLVPPKGGDGRGLAQIAVNVVKNRTRQVESQSRANAYNTLAVLEGLMRSSSSLPGRKLVFFVSDGFIADARASNTMSLLKRVTALAARTNVVVYTMDARGTFNDPAVDAGSNDFPDGMASGTSARNPMMEASAMQEPLHILAEDTGGRAIINSNSFRDAFQQAIDETSDYYLLAWRPDNEEQRSGKARIKVSIKDRPDLRVRLRRNYYVPPPPRPATVQNERKAASTAAPRTAEADLLVTLGALYPKDALPVALSVGYVNTPEQGLALKASMQMAREALGVSSGEVEKSEVDVIGAAVDDRGVVVTFKQVLTVAPDPTAQNRQQPVVWHQQLKLPPGLYQVRVAVRERSSGRTGSALEWIEVPDTAAAGGLQLSSLFLGERKSEARDEKFATAPRAVMVDVDHRFARSSVLRFQTYIYNAARGSSSPAPDVEIQTRILSDNRVVSAIASAKLPTDTTTDLARLPYWSEISLNQLLPGRYALEVTAIDRMTRRTATQRAIFIVE